MSSMLCCLRWGRRGPGKSEGTLMIEGSGAGNSIVPPQSTLSTPSAAGTRTSSVSLPQVPGVVPQVQPPFEPYAKNYDMWAEALNLLDEKNRQNVEQVVVDTKSNSTDRKDSVKDIQENLEAYNKENLDRTGRLVQILPVLSKFVSVIDVAVSFDPVHAALPWAAVRSVLVILTANNELKGLISTGFTEVISLLVRCDIYHQSYMAPEPTLRPDETFLSQLSESIVQVYASSQSFLAFMVRRRQSKTRAVGAVFYLEDAQTYIRKLSESAGKLQQAADDCERNCDHVTRSDVKELLSLLARLPAIEYKLELVLEQIDSKHENEILDWISSTQYGKHHISVRDARTPDTCEWLLQTDEFREWMTIDSSAVLWLHGTVGTGKTFLTSRVIDHVEDLLKSSSSHASLAYFYCKDDEANRKDPPCILQSYVRQLSTAVGSPGHMRKGLREFSDETKRRGSHLGFKECQTQLLQSVNEYSHTTFILDALDECNPELRGQLINVILDLVSKSDRPLKVLISSRPDQDIREKFISGPNIDILAMHNQDDIEKFVNDEIDKCARWNERMSPSLRSHIVETLLDGSQGMFQWASLQIKQVLKSKTEEDIKFKLEHLPGDLKRVYDEIYQEATEDQYAKILVDRAIKWVMSACTPLSSDELLAAISFGSIGFGNEPNESGLLDLCNDLLVVDSETKVWRFCHLSVVEYFKENHWGLRQAHAEAAEVCLKLLLETYKSPISESNIERSAEEPNTRPTNVIDHAHPFQEYVLYHWMMHVKAYEEQMAMGETEPDDSLAKLLKRFLGSPFESSVQYRGWYRWFNDMHSIPPWTSVLSQIFFTQIWPEDVPIYAMCGFSFYSLLRDWWQSAEITVTQTNEVGENSLMIAATAGCKSICVILVKRGIEPNHVSSRGHYGSPLAAAASRGNTEIVKFLVEKGADVNHMLWSGDYGSALAAAAAHGNIETVLFLIEKGADVNMILSTGFCGSALAAPALHGYIEIVRFLVEKGADVNLMLSSGNYGSALAAAATHGNIEIVRFLIEKGADVNLILSSGNYGSPLAAAALQGDIQTVRFLVEKGADVNRMLSIGNYGSPLVAAALPGDIETVRFLVEKGADVNRMLSSGDYGSALAAAASCGNIEIAKFLVEKGADVNLMLSGRDHGSALATAARYGNLESIQFLVEKGADVNLILSSGNYGSALVAATTAEWQSIEIVKFLVDKGADVNLMLSSGRYGSALAAAASIGEVEVIEFLKENGAR